ncbi:MAG TPA: hypothetical protein VH370_24880 [Humisphaera sp.]|jgi:hypothetical protein|nr:hypothetical protein [Humisphaera sp.]
MTRFKIIAAASALALSGIGTAFAQQNPSGQPANNGVARPDPVTGDVTLERQRSQVRIKGIQSLFAQATDAAVTRDGLPQLAALYAPIDALAGKPTTLPSAPAGARERADAPADPARAADDTVALNRVIDQLNREWRQKYGRDLRVTDPPLVFADITPNDINLASPQLAAGRLRPAAFNENTGTRGNPSPNGAPDRPTDNNTHGAPDRPQPAGAAGVTATETAGRELTVTAPPVMGSKSATVILIAVGAESYRFANINEVVDRHRLSAALQTHLTDLISQKDQWPVDASQAQRLASQHILMAISEAANAAPTIPPGPKSAG